MERKLGEIFTYNGKIYQVVKGFSCKGCAFIKNGCCDLVNELLGPCDYTKRTDKTNVIFKEINNMEIKNNQLTINIPEGMEIDLENSDLAKGIVRFKQSTITYEDVEDTLKLGKNCKSIIINESNASKLVTLSRLMNIAKYYNGDWKPNWSDQNECSSIWNNNNEVIGKEKGVSVYEAHKNINGTYSPVLPFPTNEMAFNDFINHIAYFTGNKYLVTGDLLDETGTDGEPLIKNVKILMKLQV